MPFLHPPTFRNRIRQASYPRNSSLAEDPLGGRGLLLGVLTLAARFHAKLVAIHSQPLKLNDPLVVSEYYAAALAAALAPMGTNLTNPSLETIQGLLMLALYEWGQTRGQAAWVYVGLATRLAQAMNLTHEDDADYHASNAVSALSQNPCNPTPGKPVSPCEYAIKREVRRRTLWSCFIMESMLSAAIYKPNMIQAEALRVRLPCSDDQFLFVSEVQTGFLNSARLVGDICIQPVDSAANNDSVLSRYIRLVEIFGRFSKSRDRRLEIPPLCDRFNEFSKLRQQLEDFHASLPAILIFTEENLLAHIEKRSATAYVSMHTLYSLCLLMLYGESLSFIPLGIQQRHGSLDEPTFPPTNSNVSYYLWEDSLERMFKATRDILEVAMTCKDRNALPESPQICLAIWHAAFICVYAAYYPRIDTGNHLHIPSEQAGQTDGDIRSKGYAGQAVAILQDMSSRLRTAKSYVKSIGTMHDYFQGCLDNFYDPTNRHQSRASTNDIGPSLNLDGELPQGLDTVPAWPDGAWTLINATMPSTNAENQFQNNDVSGYPCTFSDPYCRGQSSIRSSPIGCDLTFGLDSPYASIYHQHSYGSG